MADHVAEEKYEETDVSDLHNDDAHAVNGYIDPDEGTIETYDGEDEDAVDVSEATVAPAVPTQVANPGKATARTSFAVIIASVMTLLGALPLVLQAVLDTEGLPPKVYEVIGIAMGIIVVISGLITRIMAIPVVNELLGKIKLGASKPIGE